MAAPPKKKRYRRKLNAKVQFAQVRPWLLYTWMLASFPLHFAHMALSDLRKYKERQRGAL